AKRPSKVSVTVRHEGIPPPRGFCTVDIALIDWKRDNFFLVLLGFAVAAFIWLAYASDIIRDVGEQPCIKEGMDRTNRKPYSLARLQMASWFFVVLAAYTYIWMVTGDLGGLTPSVLTLMGISTATCLGSALVDSSSRTVDQENERAKLKRERKEIEKPLTKGAGESNENKQGAQESPTIGEGSPAETQEVQSPDDNPEIKKLKLKELDMKIGDVTQGLIKDIISDDNGVSLHRFQMLGWTIVLTTIFVIEVRQGLAMPEFDSTLLGLMGISGGAYIGFKLPAKEG
ncbi:MAG: hypothetical protein V2B18_09955, partial [Pseudomonadota bacterium]